MCQTKNATQFRLICHKIIFYSPKDEDAFFEWIKKMQCIEEACGLGDELYLDIAKKTLPEYDLRELLALFHRYRVDMQQLAIFLNDDNKQWFYENKKAYWHKPVFGATKPKDN